MDNKTTQYSISFFQYPKKDGDTPVFRADLEMTCDIRDYRERVDGLIGKFEPLPGEIREQKGHYVVCDNIHNDSDISLEEHNVIFAILHPCVENKDITIKQIDYQEAIYTDISGSNWLPKNESRTDDVREETPSFTLTANNGTDRVKLYFLSPRWMYPENGASAYRLSNGFVEAAQSRIYAGEYQYLRLIGINQYNVIDEYISNEDGANVAPYHSEIELIRCREYLHTFLDVVGEDITFWVLIDGKLHRKISKDDEKVIFYNTPFTYEKEAYGDDGYYEDYDEESWQFENFNGLVFENTDGEYYLRPPEEGLLPLVDDFDGVVLYGLPETPQVDDMDTNVAKKLFEDYETSFYYTFAAADGFHEFRRGDGLFYAAADDFVMTGVFAVPEREDVQRTELWADDLAQTLSFEIDSMSFTEGSVTGAMALDDNSSLKIFAADNKTKKILCNASFDSLRNRGVFDGCGLPEVLRFGKQYESVKENWKYYRIIKEAVVDYALRKSDASEKQGRISRKEMEELLYPEGKDWEVDENVVSFATELYNYYRAEVEATGTEGEKVKNLNVALLGEAGTGKSTLIKKIGQVVLGQGGRGEKVIVLSPSDLKGAYIGHTQPKIALQLVEAAIAQKAIYIDEAYEMMSDRFGREGVAFLLPFMTGDRTDLEVEMMKTCKLSLELENGARSDVSFYSKNPKTSNPDTLKVDFKTGQVENNGTPVGCIPRGVPPIWIGGYENEIRLLLRENQGLYRRFWKCRLPKPRTDQLYKAFWRGFEEKKKEKVEKKKTDPKIFDMLEKRLKENEDSIKDFFRWGSQLQFSKYFANYAGVELFLERCLYMEGIDKDGNTDGEGSYTYIPPKIDEVIETMKKDIKRQYHTVRLRCSNREGGDNDNNNTFLDASEQVSVIVDNKTRFTDIAGSGDGCNFKKGDTPQFKPQIDHMKDIIRMLVKKDDPEWLKLGITIPKGALMIGPPGVGKTLLARAMAGELEEAFKKEAPNKRVGFMALSASEMTARKESFISNIFDSAEEYDACVMFIDEVDTIATRRSQNHYSTYLMELIKQMDGIEERSNIFILAATNAPESLDTAFTRPGRIDKTLSFELPDLNTRRELAEIYIAKRKKSIAGFQDGDEKYKKGLHEIAQEIAKRTPGRTPGYIEVIVNTAFLEYHKAPKKPSKRAKPGPTDRNFGNSELNYLFRFFDEAIETYAVGDRRSEEKEKKFNIEKNDGSYSATAVHEVGHALVMALKDISFEKITIAGRGTAGGYVRPEKEASTKADYEDYIRMVMGGRIAEEIVYGENQISAGAYSDLRQATNTARWMVESAGFSDELGFMALTEDTARYLGENKYSCSEAFREKSDRLVDGLLKRLYQETKGMLADKRELIIKLAEKVFKKDDMTMTGGEFKKSYEDLKQQSK